MGKHGGISSYLVIPNPIDGLRGRVPEEIKARSCRKRDAKANQRAYGSDRFRPSNGSSRTKLTPLSTLGKGYSISVPGPNAKCRNVHFESALKVLADQ